MNLIKVKIDRIDEDTQQPRSNYDEESLANLVQSIKEVGLLNPIKVKQLEDGRYKIIFGHRRFKAHKILHLDTIDAILSENESDKDIYIQQLTENIQREDFSPVEEAEAFKNALENENWHMSVKYLANLLGKSERYLTNKLSLLNFGTSVKNIIHSGTQVLPSKLTEQQALPLKDLPIEYRDQVALKAAKEEMSVNDVKKVSTLFSSKEILPENKEAFLTYNKDKLLDIWSEYDLESKSKNSIKQSDSIFKPEVVKSSNNTTDDILNFETFSIEEKVRKLMNSIPSAYLIPDEVIMSYKNMKIDNREDFIYSVDCLIDNLERHLTQWRKIKGLIQSDGIKRIK